MKKLRKEKKRIFYLVLSLAVLAIVVWQIITPNKNPNFHTEADYNQIKLEKNTVFTIKEKEISALFGSRSEYLLIYKHEYIGLIEPDRRLYSMDDKYKDHKIIRLQANSPSITFPEGNNYYYLDKYNKWNESDFYIYVEYYEEELLQVNLVKNNGETGLPVTDGLNLIKIEDQYYFQDHNTGENIIEIISKNKKDIKIDHFKILSDKVSDYPTMDLIYLFFMIHYDRI
jgi:hypothetical protein